MTMVSREAWSNVYTVPLKCLVKLKTVVFESITKKYSILNWQKF
jgi:hypothetical protein